MRTTLSKDAFNMTPEQIKIAIEVMKEGLKKDKVNKQLNTKKTNNEKAQNNKRD